MHYVDESVRLWEAQGLKFVLDGKPKTVPQNKFVQNQQVAEFSRSTKQKTAVQFVPKKSVLPPQSACGQDDKKQENKKFALYSLAQAREDGSIPQNLLMHLSKQPTPIFSVWTYWEFPLDLTENALIERKALWANMYKAIVQPQNWGRDSVVFWGLSRNKNGNLLSDTALFQAGLKYLMPVYIFCFGQKAFSALFPDKPYSEGTFLYGRYALVSLPGPEKMLPDNREIKGKVWKTLLDYQPVGRLS